MAKHALLLAAGVVASALAIGAYDSQLDPTSMKLMESRATGVEDALAVWKGGGPPLTGRGTPLGAGDWETYRGYYPAGATDDVGIYLYLPAIGRALGIEDARRLLELLFLASMGVAFLVLPFLLYHATGSLLFGLVGPALAYPLLDFTVDTDVYWIAAWCYVLAIPALVAATRQRSAAACYGFLVGALVVAGFASTIRSQAGLPVLVVALVIGLRRIWRAQAPYVERVALLLVLLSVYAALSPGLITTVEQHRDERLGIDDFSERYGSGHPFWHPMYLGLGYLPNDFGISYDDAAAANAVARAAPQDPVYLSPEYEGTLRRLFFNRIRNDPAFVADTYFTKAVVLVVDVFEEFPWLFAAVPLAIGFGSQRRTFRRAVAIALPAVVVGAAPPLMTVPVPDYEVGLFGALAALGLLAIAALLVSARDAWTESRQAEGAHTIERATAERGAVVVGAALLLTLLPIVVQPFANRARDGFEYQQIAAPVDAPVTPMRAVVGSWSATELSAWEIEEGVVATRRAGALHVTTTPERAGYQVLSPAIELPPGDYVLDIDGAVERGGLAVGVFGATSDSWIRSPRGFSPRIHGSTMTIPFSLAAAAPVRVIVTNWRESDDRSEWTLRRVVVHKAADNG